MKMSDSSGEGYLQRMKRSLISPLLGMSYSTANHLHDLEPSKCQTALKLFEKRLLRKFADYLER